MKTLFAIAVAFGILLWAAAAPLVAQVRDVNFPPAGSAPPPPLKAPPKTQAGGEETDVLIAPGPTMRKSQHRTPPPPTNLTVMYKVEYGGQLRYRYPDGQEQVFDQWKSYENDAFNLVNLVNQRLKDGNNYQYATKKLATPGGFDPVDIPILYMTGDYDFALTDDEVQNLRTFLMGGGTIIFNAARGRDEFSRAVARELRKVFPQKPLMRLPLDHPIFNSFYRLGDVTMLLNGVQSTQTPEVYSVDIGTRAAAILVPGGLGTALTDGPYHPGGKHIVGEKAKRLGVNLVAYMLGSTEYGKFLAQSFPVYRGATRRGDVFRHTLVRYSGSWDVNPSVQNSLLLGLNANTTVPVDFTPNAIGLDDPEVADFPLLFMTGHYNFTLTAEESAGLARHLRRGGSLIVTAAAGLKPFDRAFRRELKKAVPDSELIRIPPTHPVFAGGWNTIDRVVYTPAALKDRPELEYPEFYGLFLDGRLAVLYTPFDLMSGVNRESNAYARGLAPDDALRVTLNVITYFLSH